MSADSEGRTGADPEPPALIARLAKLPLGLLAVVGLLLPAGVAYGLISTGLAKRSGSFMVLGALVAILWLGALAAVALRPVK